MKEICRNFSNPFPCFFFRIAKSERFVYLSRKIMNMIQNTSVVAPITLNNQDGQKSSIRTRKCRKNPWYYVKRPQSEMEGPSWENKYFVCSIPYLIFWISRDSAPDGCRVCSQKTKMDRKGYGIIFIDYLKKCKTITY